MMFTDPAFMFLALPLTIVLFYATRQVAGKTAAIAVLFLASLLIYAPWGLRNLSILVSSICVNYLAALSILLIKDKASWIRRTIYVCGQLANISVLIWFKYTIARQVYAQLTGSTFDATLFAVPIGISFYTFQQASVLADAYKFEPSVSVFLGSMQKYVGKIRGFLRYGFFISFFPHMVIGPIAYVHEIQPQVSSPRFGRLRNVNLSVGLMLVGIGMFKKLVLADNLGLHADPVFDQANAGHLINPISAWLAVFSYYTQLYFDFSGYSDMALGLARIFGIIFPINFFSPLKAVGIIDYYRRWHMTLTRVISRFLFSPLSVAGTRAAAANGLGAAPTRLVGLWLPLLVNFEIIALWHGATLTFALFGLIHGAWYVAETEVRRSRPWKQWRRTVPERTRLVLGRLLFVVPMALTFAIFRSRSIPAFADLAGQLFSANLAVDRSVPTVESFLMLLLAFGIIYLMPNSVELLRRYRPGIMTYVSESYGPRILWRPDWKWAIFWLALLMSSFYFISRQPPFLYMGF